PAHRPPSRPSGGFEVCRQRFRGPAREQSEEFEPSREWGRSGVETGEHERQFRSVRGEIGSALPTLTSHADVAERVLKPICRAHRWDIAFVWAVSPREG